MKILKTVKAIDGVCAWPNLTLLPDGTIVAVVWNQPCHGLWEGDIDSYASRDNGESWLRQSQVSRHEPGTNRMNQAVGLTADGGLLTLVSGWNQRGAVGTPTFFDEGATTLRGWAYCSSDGGHSWCKIGELPDSGQQHAYIPFGDIHRAQDSSLCVSAYTESGAFLFRSNDDGQHWGNKKLLHPAANETAICHLGGGHWLAASRSRGVVFPSDEHLDLAVSTDDGRSWEVRQPLTQPGQVTGHLLRLRDGKILVSYGNRIAGQCGVEMRWSSDAGSTWSPPMRIANMPEHDGGYPSSVEREDGVIVTAYYSKHDKSRYQMDVVLWTL
jgi:hypothetical protein